MALGMVIYVAYRKNQGLPLTKTVIAAPQLRGPGDRDRVQDDRAAHHRGGGRRRDDGHGASARGRAGRACVALYTLEVPTDLPLLCAADEAEARATRQLAEAEAFGVQYGVPVIGRLVRTRHAGRTLVDEARARSSEVIVLGSPGRSPRAVAPVRRDRRLRAAERALQGDGRRLRRVARAAAAEPCARGGARVSGRGIYRGGTFAMNLILMAIGVIVLVRTATSGGSTLAVGYLIGGGLRRGGGLRLWLLRRTAG